MSMKKFTRAYRPAGTRVADGKSRHSGCLKAGRTAYTPGARAIRYSPEGPLLTRATSLPSLKNASVADAVVWHIRYTTQTGSVGPRIAFPSSPLADLPAKTEEIGLTATATATRSKTADTRITPRLTRPATQHRALTDFSRRPAPRTRQTMKQRRGRYADPASMLPMG